MSDDRNALVPQKPGLLARVGQAASYLITGVSPDNWFGPSQPIQPQAPRDQVAGRQFDYPAGYNLAIEPRAWEGVSFPELRMLADSYDIVRLLIETRKDQMEKLDWSIRLREDKSKARGPRRSDKREQDPRALAATEFFQYPDKINHWSQWLRALLEEMIVTDAATIYPVRTARGDLHSLQLIDGSTIVPRIGLDGRRPTPPSPAYQQVIKGLPAVNYTSNELLYLPRNMRNHKVYGYSICEQIIITINIGLRRQASQLYWFTAGNTPEALVSAPESWTTDQIKSFQQYWDSIMEGNLQQRRHTRFVPGNLKYQPTKAPPLKDDFDEWLARVCCFAFSMAPTAFVRMMNRATAQTAQQTAEEEGIFPLMRWIKNSIDYTLAWQAGAPDLEFVWETDTYGSPEQRVTTLTKYVAGGVMTPNEARDDLGLDPVEGGDVLFVPTALQPIDLAIDPPAPPAAPMGTLNGKPKPGEPPNSGSGGGAAPRNRGGNGAAAPAERAEKAAGRSLYVRRPLVNGDDLRSWAKRQGFANAYPADKLHCTIAYIKQPVDWDKTGDHFDSVRYTNGARSVGVLGDEGAIVLHFEAAELAKRWREIHEAVGATPSYPTFQPHVTFTLDPGTIDLALVVPYAGELIFGPEIFEPVAGGDWADDVSETAIKTAARRSAAVGALPFHKVAGRPAIVFRAVEFARPGSTGGSAHRALTRD